MIYVDVNIWDVIVTMFGIIIVLFISRHIQKKNINKYPEYRYYSRGIFFKLILGLFLCLIYVYYYTYGDTIDYWRGSLDLSELLTSKPKVYFSIVFGNISYENYAQFVHYNVWYYMYRDPNSYAIIRFNSLLAPFSFNSYFVMTILLASLSYIGIWKLFRLFYNEFSEIGKYLAFAFLFVPSVAFWGSGIMKDTYTFSATCWLVYSFYKVFIHKEKILPNVIAIIVMSYILLSTRPFMLYICIVSIILMLTHYYLISVKGGFIKAISLVVIVVVFWGGGILLLTYLSKTAGGAYSTIDTMLEKAVITQQDLSREYYGKNSFDIGAFEPSLPGILSKAPVAINAGLYYPYIWKTRNAVMLISGLENLFLLLLSLYVLVLIIVAIFKIGPRYMLKTLFNHPLVIFSLSYAIPFAFMVGLTTANYGALVRYKIPLIPFFLSSLFIIINRFNKQREKHITK